ncbi:MAG: dephospho-CoA kinase [Bacteroidota bacterium]
MVFIGITGGIGSGKSLVCSLFEKKGVPIFYADDVAKEISNRLEVKKEIIREFGNTIILPNGDLDRKKLATIVFSEHEKLLRLNSIVHPSVFLEFDTWKRNLHSLSSYALAEAALLFESSMDKRMDYTLVIAASDDIRVKRVMERDKVSKELVQARMVHQLPMQDLIERADFVLRNDGTQTELKAKVNFFHTVFSTLTQRTELQ